MPEPYVVVLSGPERTRAAVEVALEDHNLPHLPAGHHGRMFPDRCPDGATPKLHWLPDPDAKPTEPHGFLSLVAKHPDQAAQALDGTGWVLRAHYPMPEKPPEEKPHPIIARMAELEVRLAALEQRGTGLPPIGGGSQESPPAFIQGTGLSFGAEQSRRAVFAWAARTAANSPGIISGGLLSASDCQLSAPGSGMSVNVGTGEMIIGGNEGGSQGGYGPCRITSTTNLSISAANPSLPRIDTVVGSVADSNYTLPSDLTGNQFSPVVITGTPTSGATLSNLSGAAAVPGSSLVLGYVLVPAAASNIVSGDIANVATVMQTGPQPQYGRGYEWSYAQITSPVNVTSTTESAGTTVLSPAAFTPDGSPVLVEFFSPYFNLPTAALGNSTVVCLFEGATELARLAQPTLAATAAQQTPPIYARYRFTPTAASHTYTITGFVPNTTGTPQVGAGAGGTAAFPPAFVRFTKV